ncbi:MAG TPA: deoxynucleoside kinase [Anaerolineales bacterium]|nr:deoxynucleoside kinase [Anaerolineales bacterium]HRQ92560.1 deoxynucleoside kinase [Anaerolineales bacterium]
MKHFVAVAGNIGVGKSTLVAKLATHLQWNPYYEPVAENPYLEDFYSDMRTWAFQSQVFFLRHRLSMHLDLLADPNSVIQDRSVYEDAEIFAKNLFLSGQMDERDYTSYRNLYTLLCDLLRPPDLVIYLRASVPTLQRRIAQRGRDFEAKISTEYLEQLNGLYEDWVTNFTLCPVLTVPTDNMNFVTHDGLIELVKLKMSEKLMGKEEVVFLPEEVESFASFSSHV